MVILKFRDVKHLNGVTGKSIDRIIIQIQYIPKSVVFSFHNRSWEYSFYEEPVINYFRFIDHNPYHNCLKWLLV